VKDLVKDYKENRNWIYGSQCFSSEVVLTKDCYGHKGKGYATEVVTTTEKPPPDGFGRYQGQLRRSAEPGQ